MKQTKRLLAVVLTVCMLLTMATTASFAGTTVYDTSNSAAFLSWKAFNTLLGYNDVGTVANSTTASIGVYEFRNGGDGGDLKYAWTFDGTKYTAPILSGAKGPIMLHVTEGAFTDATVSAAASLPLTFDLYKPEAGGLGTLSGDTNLKYDVSSFFEEGTNVSISDGAGYTKSTEVSGGFVSFDVTKGAIYTLAGTHKLTQRAPTTVYTFKPNIVSGTGTVADPYMVNYTSPAASAVSISWKSIDGLIGYTVSGTAISPTQLYQPSVAVFQYTGTDSIVKWAWTLDGSQYSKPIDALTLGPTNLSVTPNYDSSTSVLKISFGFMGAHGVAKYDFKDYYPSLKLYVGDHYADGTKLALAGPVAGSADREAVTVSGGYVAFGANVGCAADEYYTLTPTVAVEPGSEGTAGNGTVTGLIAGGIYKVTEGTNVYWATANGTLSSNKDEAAPLTGTEITGLDNTKTYRIQRVYAVDLNLSGGNGSDAVSIAGTSYTTSASGIYLPEGTAVIKATPASGREVTAFSDSVDTGKTKGNATDGYNATIIGTRSIAITFAAVSSSGGTTTPSTPTERAPFSTFTISSGDGTSSSPYIVNVDRTFSLSWKAIDMMIGYAEPDSNAASLGSKIYLPSVITFRMKESGRLEYAWTLDGTQYTSGITAAHKGPTGLNVTKSYNSTTGVLTASCVFMDTHGTSAYSYGSYYPSLMLYVGDSYSNGTKLKVSGSGAKADTVTVSDGYATFGVNKGGDYTLTPSGSAGTSSAKGQTITSSVTASEAGNASVATITKSTMDSLIAQAKNGGSDTVIELKVVAPATAVRVQTVLPVESIAKIQSSNLGGARIDTPIGSMELDNTTLKKLAETAAGKELSVGIQKVDPSTLTAEQKAAVGDSLVVDLSIVSNGKTISEFGGGKVTVSIPYELKAGDDGKSVAVWYLDDHGNLTRMEGAHYDAALKKVVFTTTHFSQYVIGKDQNPFADVKNTDWFYGSVLSMSSKGLINGISDSQFAPAGTANRGMLVTILWRMENKPSATANTFQDTAAGAYYNDAVSWAAANGIVTGFGNTFRPNDNITREQLAAILYRYAKYKQYDLTVSGSLSAFTDQTKISAWADEAILWAASKDLLKGDAGKNLNPKDSAQRAQVAAVMERFLDLNGK